MRSPHCPRAFGAGERGAQRLRRARELGCRPQRLLQALHQLAVLLRSVALQRADQLAHASQFVAHRREPFADRISMQRELTRSCFGSHAELVTRDRDHRVDRGTNGRLSIDRALPCEVVAQSPYDGQDDERTHRRHQCSHNQVPCHAAHHAEGV